MSEVILEFPSRNGKLSPSLVSALAKADPRLYKQRVYVGADFHATTAILEHSSLLRPLDSHCVKLSWHSLRGTVGYRQSLVLWTRSGQPCREASRLDYRSLLLRCLYKQETPRIQQGGEGGNGRSWLRVQGRRRRLRLAPAVTQGEGCPSYPIILNVVPIGAIHRRTKKIRTFPKKGVDVDGKWGVILVSRPETVNSPHSCQL